MESSLESVDLDVMRTGLLISPTCSAIGSGYEELKVNGVEEGRNDSILT